jgi:hypothetical protein
MSERVMPDSLVNTLIRHKDGTVKRVVRDDGPNGLRVSPPENPVAMRPVSRDEFESDWELHQTVEEQLKENAPGVEDRERPFRGQYAQHKVGADLSSQVTLPSVDSRNGVDTMTDSDERQANDPFGGRATPSKREDAEEYTRNEPADETFSGEPVGGNEEPAELFEEERADPNLDAGEPEDTQEAVQEQHGEPKKAKKAKKTK